MTIGEIKKKGLEKFEIPFNDMDLGDSIDVSLEGEDPLVIEDYYSLISRLARLASGPEEENTYGRRSPGFKVDLMRPRQTGREFPIIHICRTS